MFFVSKCDYTGDTKIYRDVNGKYYKTGHWNDTTEMIDFVEIQFTEVENYLAAYAIKDY